MLQISTTQDSSHGCRGWVCSAPPPPALLGSWPGGARFARPSRWRVDPLALQPNRAGATATGTHRPSRLGTVAARSGGCELSNL